MDGSHSPGSRSPNNGYDDRHKSSASAPPLPESQPPKVGGGLHLSHILDHLVVVKDSGEASAAESSAGDELSSEERLEQILQKIRKLGSMDPPDEIGGSSPGLRDDGVRNDVFTTATSVSEGGANAEGNRPGKVPTPPSLTGSVGTGSQWLGVNPAGSPWSGSFGHAQRSRSPITVQEWVASLPVESSSAEEIPENSLRVDTR